MSSLFKDENPVFAKNTPKQASPTPATLVTTDDELAPPIPLNSAVSTLTPTPSSPMVMAPKPANKQMANIDFNHIDALIDSNEDNKATSGVSTISKQMLSTLRASDADVFGKKLNELVVLAKGLDPKNMKNAGVMTKLTHFFGTTKEKFMAQYSSVEHQMDALVAELDKATDLHRKRIQDFNTMYAENYQYHEALTASQQKKVQLKGQLVEQLNGMGQPTDAFGAQNLSLMKDRIDRLDKIVNDLERAKLLAKQMAPEIRQLENNARSLVETFTNVKGTTIPAWRNAFTLYVAQLEQKTGAELANNVYDATDEAFRQQADLFKENTESIARVSQRSVVSVETLEYVQTQLMSAFDNLDKIQAEGKKARAESEPRIAALEKQLVDRFSNNKLSM